MRLLLVTLVIILAFANQVLYGDGKSPSYETMNLEDAKRLLNTSEGYKPLQELVAAAFHAERMDLLQLCFENQLTCFAIRDGVKALPDSVYKDKLVLMMLKEASPYWPVDDPLFRWSSPELGGLMKEPFISVLKKNLPTIPLDESLLDNRAARLQLARKLEDAITTRAPKSAPEARELATPSSLPPPSVSPTASPMQREANTVQKLTPASHSQWWIAAALMVCLVIAAFAFFGRRV